MSRAPVEPTWIAAGGLQPSDTISMRIGGGGPLTVREAGDGGRLETVAAVEQLPYGEVEVRLRGAATFTAPITQNVAVWRLREPR